MNDVIIIPNMNTSFDLEKTSVEIQVVNPTDTNVYKTINGITFYKKIKMVYQAYKKGDIMIALDINDIGAKSYALLPNTLAVQTLIMSCLKQERAFYDICVYSSKHNIRSYPVKLFFDIEEKDENKERVLFTKLETNYIVTKLYHNVCEVLLKYYALDYDSKNLVLINSGNFFDWDEHRDHFEGYSWADWEVEMERVYEGKFSSFHVVFNKIHFCNIKSMSDFYETHKDMLTDGIYEKIDHDVYSPSRAFRLPECTKKGQERYLQIISPDHDFQDGMLCAISEDSILVPTTKKDLERKPTPIQTPTSETVSSMEKEFLDNIELFTDDANSN